MSDGASRCVELDNGNDPENEAPSRSYGMVNNFLNLRLQFMGCEPATKVRAMMIAHCSHGRAVVTTDGNVIASTSSLWIYGTGGLFVDLPVTYYCLLRGISMCLNKSKFRINPYRAVGHRRC